MLRFLCLSSTIFSISGDFELQIWVFVPPEPYSDLFLSMVVEQVAGMLFYSSLLKVRQVFVLGTFSSISSILSIL